MLDQVAVDNRVDKDAVDGVIEVVEHVVVCPGCLLVRIVFNGLDEVVVGTIVFCNPRGMCSRSGFFAAWRPGLDLGVST
jgi:hypothetical protein